MAAHTRINPDTYYVNGVAIPASFFQAIDTAQASGIDGDAGNGTWTPSSAINIGGAGCGVAGQWLLNGAATIVEFSSVAPLVHGDNDYIQIEAGQALSTRTLVTQINLGKDSSGCSFVSGGLVAGKLAPMFTEQTFQAMTNLTTPGGRLVCPLRVHNGATLTQVTFTFVIATGRTFVPATLPRFRAHKVDIAGNLTPLLTTGSVDNGYMKLVNSPNTAAHYMTLTSFVYTPDANTVIDTSTYSYFVEILDETGLHALGGNFWVSAAALFAIGDMQPQ